jgi:hypothetical protein
MLKEIAIDLLLLPAWSKHPFPTISGAGDHNLPRDYRVTE